MAEIEPLKRISIGYVRVFEALISEEWQSIEALERRLVMAPTTLRRTIQRLSEGGALEKRQLHPHPVYRAKAPVPVEAREHVVRILHAAEALNRGAADRIGELLEYGVRT